MSALPPHHVARPRLTGPCRREDASLIVVEAAAGYGKSVFAAELVAVLGDVPVEVLLEEGPVSAMLLAGRLRSAVARAGFVAAAAAMSSAGEDPAGTVDAMLDAMADESYAIVVDDAHHAARDAAVLIDRIAARIARPGRLVVLARRLPPGAERLRRAEAVVLGAGDLALRGDEALAVCRDGFGLEVTPDDVRLLEAATDGWTAAAVLAASRAKRTDRRLRDVARPPESTARSGGAETPVTVMLDEALPALAADRAALSQLGRLPLLDRALVADVTGDDGFFDRAVALGLPLTPTGRGWWELPGPVRDHLASLEPVDEAALLSAARSYEERGELGIALQVLLAAGEATEAAALLERLDVAGLGAVDALELLAVYESLPDAVVARHPRATFHVARGCGAASLLGPRARLLDRLSEVTAERDPELRRAIDAEVAIDLVNKASPLEAEALGRRVLSGLGESEQFTRARALTAIAFGLCAHREPDGRLSTPALTEAAGVLDQAGSIYRALGCPEWVSGVAAPRALWTELGLGRATVAFDVLTDAIADCAGHPRRVGRLLFHRAQVLAELGRLDEGEEDLAAAERMAGQHGDAVVVAFAHWGRMAIASYRGDADATMRNAHEVEARRGDWWPAVGAEFLAEAADCLDRVGYPAQAQEYLSRSKDEPHRADRWTALAECALAARHGDPAVAEELASTVHRHGLFPKEEWRVTLLRAHARARRGDASAGALAARAFEEADRIGQPQAPFVREREVAESLLVLAAETGSPAAARLEVHALPRALAVLGRFELSRGGRAVAIRPGQSAQLLKLVAVSGGRVTAERAIETLWPSVEPSAGRHRLRTVLGRLREAAPDVVARDGEVLVLAPDVRLDLAQFEQEARQATAFGLADPGPAVALATSAISRYRGDVLPDDVYEEWADEPREAARRTMLELLDLCAEAAARRGDLDEVRRMVQRTIELAPYEDDRYLRVAQILNDQGRRGAALSVIRRARATLATLGVDLAPQLLELRDSLVTSPS
ncbi:MAG TPA: BTAD domain-containing putative transcriptional regulator [Acidimicrobiales bacterium]|nr:BTAD domain-containing putative transcriptional regulator [Acidimicrobiales bacterium]